MAIAGFLIEIFAATMLLLFAVRLVRTGIERRFGALFQSLLTRHSNTFVAGGAGMVLATILQSSAAVTVLLTGFAAAGMVSFGLALAGVLGADLGAALVIQVLSYDLGWLQPVLLALGGWLYLKSDRANVRLIGRIVLGIAFILVSLQFLRDAVDPIRESAFLPAIAGYLESDYFSAFIVGAVLAFVMHSSVATILMCVTLVQIGAIPFAAGLSLVLGANLGSAFIPIWLTRDLTVSARRIPLANLLLRGSAALVMLIVVNVTGTHQTLMVAGAGQSLILAHIGFNLAVFVLATGFVNWMERPMALLLPEPEVQANAMDHFSDALRPLNDPSASGANVAISSVRHELLQMVTQVERMFRPVLDIYEQDDSDAISALWQQDERVNAQLTEIRRFVARMPRQNMSKAQIKAARGLVEYAIRLEAAGDVVSNRMTRTAQIKHTERTDFSAQGWKELKDLHAAVLASFSLARHVLLVDDMDCARRLVLDKAEVKRLSRNSRKAHLKRLERGQTESFASSDLHLETLRAMRDLHGHIAAIAYPILYQSGQVLETRLVMEMDNEAVED
ncbi:MULTISPECIES: Na/Pi cotransporter family protein [unclassified Ruegeria]|uniref:Na/Pi cotransporter family protein n=1 Tax=unclassified Ruegeria TaxID=2625375 RepID=UPI001ADC5DB6|nr:MULTISPECIES: Na/Pi cotransporter family protein [unclassified Ruegeria]MBO9410255.1 Na/Pi cotransporter family protein [Ruegeria sp. R8_1]MBO9414526.1 Na/Pi cotransporter family protein [Ruegeria sp. R8_2]